MSEIFNATIAALLTLMVFSYLLRDNPLFRIAEHLLVATSIAYATTVAIHGILAPRLLSPLAENAVGRADLLIPLTLGLLLLAKALPRGRNLGRAGLAYLVGMGLALAVGGALIGTLLPQIDAASRSLLPGDEGGSLLANLVLLVGTIAVLISFLYYRGEADEPLAERGAPMALIEGSRRLGRWVLMITFGTLFGGATLTFTSLLVARGDFLINEWLRPLLGF